jgi:hypothetical protein
MLINIGQIQPEQRLDKQTFNEQYFNCHDIKKRFFLREKEIGKYIIIELIKYIFTITLNILKLVEVSTQEWRLSSQFSLLLEDIIGEKRHFHSGSNNRLKVTFIPYMNNILICKDVYVLSQKSNNSIMTLYGILS